MEPTALPVPLSQRTLTILLIEDSDTVRSFLHHSLRAALPGATIVEAAEGRAALRELTRCRADLIITDLQMPGMDGRAFLATLRQNPILRHKRVLVLSSDNSRDLRDRYASDPHLAILPKPSTGAEILRVAQDLLADLPASAA
jgi:two-component system cell cycle sensor histidine kinase/response regulator CckA